MKIDILLGLQWGDEGKGKIVDVLTPRYDIIARFQGGPNAGHTIEFDNKKFILHTIPSGIFNEEKINVVGNGVIIDPVILCQELDSLLKHGINAFKNLRISKKAHLILPSHRLLDAAYEAAKGDAKIGSTLKGIGPTYTDKTARLGIRIGNTNQDNFREVYEKLRDEHLKLLKAYNFDYENFQLEGMSFQEYESKWFSSIKRIQEIPFINSEYFINQSLKEGKKILAEGAQGTMLDVDFGTYPFVTSSNTVTAGVCTGLGVAPHSIGDVFGIFKAYCTRVGSGPFPTELLNKQGQKLRDEGGEYGSTTGRPRRCGWVDLVALKYAIMLNGVTQLFMTKADVLNSFDEIAAGIAYTHKGETIDYIPFEASYDKLDPVLVNRTGWKEDLEDVTTWEAMPEKLRDYVQFVEEQTGIPVKMISTGPDRKQVIAL